MTLRETVARAIADANYPGDYQDGMEPHYDAQADAAIAAVLDDLIAEADENVQRCAGHLDDEASWIDTAEWLRSKKDQT